MQPSLSGAMTMRPLAISSRMVTSLSTMSAQALVYAKSCRSAR